MNITDNLIRIKEGKDNIIKSLKNKGVDIADNTLINEIPTIIDNAEIGGGDTPSQPEIQLIPKYEGASVFRIEVPEDNTRICFAPDLDSYKLDWGDGSDIEEINKSDYYFHIYEKKGVYDINMWDLLQNSQLKPKKLNLYSGSSTWANIFIYPLDNPLSLNGEPKFDNNDYINYITHILIGENIYSIGDYTFTNCKSLKSVVIPEGVTSIGSYAFYSCSSLQSVELPSTLTSIGQYVFHYCYSLKSIELPSTLTSIGNYTFIGCSSLQSIVIPEGVTSFGYSVFQDCSSLQSIVIPKSATYIANMCQNCYSLESVVISEGVTKIDNYAFENCYSLKSIVIPESVTSIGDYAFRTCSSLQSVELPSTLRSIGTYAFQNCYSLKSVVIPEGVTSFGSNAFDSCYSLKSVVIPESVTSLNYYTFQNCFSLQSIELPSTLTSIGYGVFQYCYSLQTIYCKCVTAPTLQSYTFTDIGIYLPNTVEKVLCITEGASGYEENYWKSTVLDKGFTLSVEKPSEREKIPTEINYTLDGNNIFIRYYSFYPTTPFTNTLNNGKGIISLENQIYTIGRFSFCYQPIENIDIPECVTTLQDRCFCGCDKLQNITIPSSIIRIGEIAFKECTKLSTITCKAMTAPTIQSNTFQNVGTSVPKETPKVLRIPEGASGYEEKTSQWYKQLIKQGYTIEYIKPNSLTYTSTNGNTVTPYAKSFEGENEIVSNVYENGIGTITFKEGLNEIYDSMYNQDVVGELTTIEIPNGITRIGDYSFRSQYLTTLNVPNSVTTIGDSAFNGCTKLTEITLGSGVETIGQWAFSSCTKVSTITSMAMVAPTFNQSFLNVGGDVSGEKILRVPEGSDYSTWLPQLSGFTIEYI